MALAEEVRRIITSPYAVSLKGLHVTLESTDARELGRWASGNACQIDALATAVLDGLRLWPYTMIILTRLASILSFRDAVLRQSPALLNQLLDTAINSDHEECSVCEACVSILTHPLPKDYGVPALFPQFLLHLVEKVTREASAATLRPLHSLITGGRSTSLSILPLNTINQFQEQLIGLLKSLEDQSTSLLCLAIFARISYDHPISAITDHYMKDDDWYRLARQFFTAKRVSKTLDLVILRAILATSGSIGVPQAVESLQLAAEIVDVIEFRERTAWQEKNLAKLKKLVEKVSQPNVDHTVRVAALAVLVSLAPKTTLPEEPLWIMENCLQISESGNATLFHQSVNQNNILQPPISSCLKAFLETHTDQVSNLAVESHMSKLLHTVSLPRNTDNLFGMLSARLFTGGLTQATRKCSELRQAILTSLMSSSLREPLQAFISDRSTYHEENIHGGQDICPSIFAETKRLLQYDICMLVVKATLHSTGTTDIDPSISADLLSKAEKLADPVPECRGFKHFHSTQMASSSLAVDNTPMIPHHGANWRNRLTEELNQEANKSRELIARIVDDTCRDLEDRCNNAEVPLRKEQAINRELQDQVTISISDNRLLKRNAREQASIMDALENEKISLTNQASADKQEIKQLTEELEEMRERFNEAKKEVLTTGELAVADAKRQELNHLAFQATKEELLEERALSLAEALVHSKTLEAQVVDLTEEALKLKSRLKECESEMTESKAVTASYMEEAECLSRRDVEQTERVEALKCEIQQMLLEANKVQAVWMERVSNLETLASTVNQKHENENALKDIELANQARCFNQSLSSLQAELDELKSSSLICAQKQERKIKGLQEKVRGLYSEREECLAELEHAQDLKTKVMAVIGIPVDQPLPNRKALQPLRSPNRARQIDFQVAEDMDPNDLTESRRALGSSATGESGFILKRSRIRQNRKSSTMQLGVDADLKAAKRAHFSLNELRRESRQGPNPSNLDQENKSMQESFSIDDLCFDQSDIFASTGPQQEVEDVAYNETTADFDS